MLELHSACLFSPARLDGHYMPDEAPRSALFARSLLEHAEAPSLEHHMAMQCQDLRCALAKGIQICTSVRPDAEQASERHLHA